MIGRGGFGFEEDARSSLKPKQNLEVQAMIWAEVRCFAPPTVTFSPLPAASRLFST